VLLLFLPLTTAGLVADHWIGEAHKAGLRLGWVMQTVAFLLYTTVMRAPT
jgi:hypothetical protein